jgi:glycerol dehydrogenase
VLENAPRDEIDEVVRIIKAVGLPLTLKDMGLKHFVEAEWRKVAEVACNENDTMGNMPKQITPEDVYQAMIAANALAERYQAMQ